MQGKRSACVFIVATLIGLSTIAGTAANVRAEEMDATGPPLTGSWVETVSPVAGAPFTVLNTFGKDGVWISSAQGNVVTGPPFPSAFTAAQGQWTHRGGRSFSTTALSLGSNVTNGQLMMVLKIRATVTVDVSGDAYHAELRTEIFDPAGNFLFGFDATSEARRIGVEPLD